MGETNKRGNGIVWSGGVRGEGGPHQKKNVKKAPEVDNRKRKHGRLKKKGM